MFCRKGGCIQNASILLWSQRCVSGGYQYRQGAGGSFKDRKPIGKTGCCASWMAERTTLMDRKVVGVSGYLSVYLSIGLSIYLSISLSLSGYLSIYLSVLEWRRSEVVINLSLLMILDNYPPDAPESPASAFGLLGFWCCGTILY